MLNLRQLQSHDLQGLAPEAVMVLAQQMLEHIQHQDHEIKVRDLKIEKITFELARLRGWKFGAKTEAMNAEQRRLFEETLTEDEAALQAQLRQAKGEPAVNNDTSSKRRPKRQPLPADLRWVEHRHEPQDTRCPTPGCGQEMVRVGRTPARSWMLCLRSSSCIATSTASGPAAAARA
jgi:hypothetical protein